VIVSHLLHTLQPPRRARTATIWDSANLRGLADRDQDVVEGIFTTWGAATLDVNYGYYSRLPFDTITSVNELGGRLTLDVARPWQTPGEVCTAARSGWDLRGD
jgi:hypothetical protein